MSRPKVKKIKIWVEGKKKADVIDPAKTAAIFFTDQAVQDILVPFYGPGGKGAGKGVDAMTLWNTTISDKEAAYLIKIPECGIISG